MTAPGPGFAFDETYYRHGFGAEPYERTSTWLEFFRFVAEALIRAENPATVLDAGCAMGMLVESFRDRGVEAWGIDISHYAISCVRDDMKPFCRAGSISDRIEGCYDLVTCIEVIEHIPPAESSQVLRNLTVAADTILFSSSPDDHETPSHVNVRPIREWLRLFSELGFEPDVGFDAGFVSPHAFLLRKMPRRLAESVKETFARNLTLRGEPVAGASSREADEHGGNHSRTDARTRKTDRSGAGSNTLDDSETALRDELRLLRDEVEMLRAHSESILRSPGWHLVASYRRWLHRWVWPRPILRKLADPIAAQLMRLVRAEGDGVRGSASARNQSSVGSPQAVLSGPSASLGMHLRWDGPNGDQRVRDVVEIHGWVAAVAGIQQVELTLDGGMTLPLERHRPRLDVLKHMPHLPSTLRPGFRAWWDTTLVSPGWHRLRLTALSRDGQTASLERSFLVDQRDEYQVWQTLSEPTHAERRKMWRIAEDFAYRPLISLLVPVYQSNLDHLARCIASVTSQLYSHWELCIADDGSNDPGLSDYLDSLVQADSRIRVTRLPENRGIAEATNAAFALAAGEFVAFLDHDDEIADFALFEVVTVLNADPASDVLYSDEDKLDECGNRYFPFFKPDWSPDYFHSCNYMCHFLVCRRELLEAVGRLRPGFDGSQDYDVILRLTERTTKIRHIPKILYHWRTSERSAAWKPEASAAGARALLDHLRRLSTPAEVIEIGPARYRVKYRTKKNPRVALIIPTGGNVSRLNEALSSVLAKTLYDNYEILVVDNSSNNTVEKFLTTFQAGRLPLTRFDRRGLPFNFSKLCNEAVRETEAPYLLFLNDDVSVISSGWIDAMMEHAQRPGVGAVGALLRYPDGKIQHAGIVIGLFGNCGQTFRGLTDEECYMGLQDVVRNVSAVTGACLLVRRELFAAVGGFDEVNLPLAYQDVDLCLRLGKKGYRTVYTPYAELYHHESASKSATEKIAGRSEIEYMKKQWTDHIANDPYYNLNLTRVSEEYSLRLETA
ncbi:MAG: glycosyltransferase [Acidobacteria bacterium]|nr:glycosyltransferase [Acidobacteriota bacterium]